ncbi:hypothetical protein [Apibacter mensalis]|nr:hypothetical protein [Apibacter mensalis]
MKARSRHRELSSIRTAGMQGKSTLTKAKEQSILYNKSLDT